jgi:hypothetical protein
VVLLVNNPVPCTLISERFSCADAINEKLRTTPATTTARFISEKISFAVHLSVLPFNDGVQI